MWVCSRPVTGDTWEYFSGVAIGGVVLWTKSLRRAVHFDSREDALRVTGYYAKRFPDEFAPSTCVEHEDDEQS